MELTLARMHTLERMLTGATLVLLAVLAWGYLAAGDSSGGMTMPEASGAGLSSPGLLAAGVIMWTIMMVAMMLPGATPMIMTYVRVHQRRATARRAVAPTWLFVAGYLCVWTGFGIVAAVSQWMLHQHALMTSAMGHVGPVLGGILLVIAGAFQFSRLKEACLSKCRSPVGFLMTEWRDGKAGAFMMGARHGVFCTGCCWALMLLMFAGGVMSLAWMGALALFFLVEKLVPRPRLFSRTTGALLIAAGILTAVVY